MNCVYFACKTCQLYIDAGYRWTQTLPETIQLGQSVDMNVVFSAKEYWAGVEGDECLQDLLRQIKTFLQTHKEHEVIFGQEEDFHQRDAQSLGWMDEEVDNGLGVRSAIEYFWGPKHFAEKLRYTKWEQVVEHVSKLQYGNWWYDDTELRFEGRRKFEHYIRLQAQSDTS